MEEDTLLVCRKTGKAGEDTSLVWRKTPHLYGGRHLISMEKGTSFVWGEGTSLVWRKAGKAGEGSNGD